MIGTHQTSYPLPALAVLLLGALSGCAANPGQPEQPGQQGIEIDSAPAGASVTAVGRVLGQTPLRIVPGDVFPVGMVWGSKEGDGIASVRYTGELRIEKAGCLPYTTEVDDHLLSKDVFVRLDCPVDAPATHAGPDDPVETAEVPRTGSASAPHPVAVDSGPSGSTEDSAETRLLRLRSLHDKGLISDEEYRRIRQVILDTL